MFALPSASLTHASDRRTGFLVQAALAVALLALGVAGHWAHHLIDPHCVDGQESTSHPCACSTLHGPALGTERLAVGPSAPLVHPTFGISEINAPAIRIAEACAPRGPPLA